MRFFLGIDGGGSKTVCAVGDEQRVLGKASSPGCKLTRVGENQARSALADAIHGACEVAGVSPQQIAHTCAGVAGTSRAEAAASVHDLLSSMVSGKVEVVTDASIALEAAFSGEAGCIVIAGTGSIAYGRNERGDTARAGGWGTLISDQGSGEWIGRAALTAAMRIHDQGLRPQLLATLGGAWQVVGAEELAGRANGQPAPDFAALFPAVLQASKNGDAHASEVLSRAGFELAGLAKTVIQRLWPGPRRVRVCITGGVFQNSILVRTVFVNSLRAERREVSISLANVDPVLGALTLARKAEASIAATGSRHTP